MDYLFGYEKKPFTGTKEEWNQLQNTIAWWIESSSIYPFITVKCPHCGSINNHNIMNYGIRNHKPCNLHYYKGVRVYYECPGYKIGIYLNN